MEKFKRLFLLKIPIVALLILMAACGKQSTDPANSYSSVSETDDWGSNKGKPKVAVVLKALNSEYFKLMEYGAEKAFKDLDVDGKVMSPSNETEVEKQINMLEDLLNNKSLDALIVMPSQSEAVIPVLKKYKEKDIPVLLVDSDVDWEGKTTYIGTDNFTAGQKAGESLVTKLGSGDKVAILEGVSGTPNSEERVKGAEEAIKKAGLKLVASQSADFNRVKAVSTMENILTANPDLKGVIAVNDEMALGALRATKARNMDIPIIGIDGITEAVESINDGVLEASVAQKPNEMAYKSVENALKVIKGEKIDKRIDIGIDIITKENSQEKLEELKGMLGK
ncbi:sugar ABC transporter substrate-binding protein [Neobacillus mesonae]|uniref:sugar ABC transporter substrate-binding protein n=1 Tax=Neobacillus mesonae TaxID=1193713 RepID=UPI002041AC05|nr:sugar ABC transporter substrate-binding protein [Neobacillus mesonae]MCM3569881.1 sugar ABC transporter substrate-binding protein [Neobacillus mesonae]